MTTRPRYGDQLEPDPTDDDLGDRSAEQRAMHVERERPARGPRPTTHADRLDLLEAEVSVLLALAQVLTEAVDELSSALERLPTEEPDAAAVKVGRAAHRAHQLVLSLRDVPR